MIPGIGRVRLLDGALSHWFVRIWTLIGIGILLYAAWRLLNEPLGIVLPPLALAAVIVYLLNPCVCLLRRWGLPRLLGVSLAYVALLAGTFVLGSLVGPVIVEQTGQFVDQIPEITARLLDALNAQLRRFGIPPVQADTAEWGQTLRQYVSENTEQVLGILRGAGSVAGRILHVLLTIVLAPILAFYLLADLPRVTAGIQRLVPPGGRREFLDVSQRILTTVGRYFRGQLLVAAFVGVATSLGLAVIGLPFWALVGSLTGVFNLVPLIGPFFGGAIGVGIALTVGGGVGQAIAVVVVMTAVQQIDNHAITPIIHAKTVKIHPVTVIIGLLLAGTLFGIVGMLVVIPVIAAAKLVLLHLLVTHVPSMRYLAAEGPGLFGIDVAPRPARTAAGRGGRGRPGDASG